MAATINAQTSPQFMDEHTYTPLPAGHAALRKGRASLPNTLYLVTATTHQRKPVFRDHELATLAARCFHDRRVLKDSRLLAWVLMPDHVHWLLQLGETAGLSDTILRLKCASARAVNRQTESNGTLWSRAFHDRALRAEEDVQAIARYVIANPVRAGLATRSGDYPFWNAVWL